MNPNHFKLLQSQISMSLTKFHPSGVSDSQDTTKLQIRAHNTQQSLTQLCVGNYTNLLNILAHIICGSTVEAITARA